uniref:F5/8 type C domain-containing protein n=1 Tax=Hemiselmis andersenii TaxID=464988 RepID=A0A6U2FRA7_HEMAN|mmetsp:Transcript_3360/g.7737  ORF Transcript_3360/g.7737 Transcript_3360/m.7737 type:complete len:136 (-) Transcript_3360:199-606(-)
MADFGLASAGAEVIFTTCNDENHPGTNIVDGNDKSFWVTTGLFPQQFIIQFKDEVKFSKLKSVTTNVRKISFEKCTEMSPTSFEKFYEVELASPQGGRIQQETHPVKEVSARFLRVTLASGWDDFASVHRISVEP